jgi:RHS repeat-associated protein
MEGSNRDKPREGCGARRFWIALLTVPRNYIPLASACLALCAAVGEAVAQSPPLVPPVPHRPSGILAASGTTISPGRTEGGFAVSSTGAATYTIPIWAPPGPQGVQPRIALTYNSRMGNGPLGVGWGISGLSSIYRCNLTFAQDAAPAPVALTYSDRFCIDGKRLRLTSSESLSTYGQDGTTYQTEVADFSNVTAHGVAGNGPAYFTVQGKDGLTYSYGNGGNSQVLATGTSTALSWQLNQVADRAGNTMTISYTTTTGTAVPATISWTPSTHGSSTYNYTMTFNYGTNVAPPQGYVGGAPYKNPNLLSSITINYLSATVKNYVLGYQQSPTSGRDQLIQVQECADSGATNCLSPTTMTYQSGGTGVNTNSNTAIGSTTITLPYTNYDFNGDGYTDLVYCNGGSPSIIYVAFNSANGFGTPVNTGILCSNALYGDVQGTGTDGILAPNGNTWYYYTWNGTAFTGVSTGVAYDSTAWQYLVADVNGDGLPDLIAGYLTPHVGGTYTLNVYTRLNSTPPGGAVSFSSTNTLAFTTGNLASAQLASVQQYQPGKGFDFNGDGRQDIALETIYGSNGSYSINTYELISNGSTFSGVLIASAPGSTYTPVTFLNFNSDACTDYLWQNTIYISGCNGTVPATITVPSGTPVLTAMDWNGDGLTDIVVANGSTIGVYVSDGSGLSSLVSTSLPYSSANQYLAFDANSDGLDGLGVWVGANTTNQTTSITYSPHNGAGQPPDLLSSVTDGFAMQVSFTYAPLPSGAAYSPDIDSSHAGPDPTYPHSGGVTLDPVYIGPLYVTSQFSASDGTGGTYTNSFWYYGARMNRQGRGFDGFYAKRTLDSRKPTSSSPNGRYTYEYFRRDFPYTGMTWETLIDQPNNSTAMSTVANSFATESLDATQYNTRQFPYVGSSVENTYEAGGTGDGSWITQKTTTYAAPDIYGNFPTITVATTDKDSGSPFLGSAFTQVLSHHFSYGSPSSDWCIHIPDTTSIQSTLPDNTSLTRHYGSQGQGVDYTNCRVTDEYIEAGSSTLAVTTHYAFDSWGNHSSVTVTGRNPDGTAMAPRTTNYTFGTSGQLPEVITNVISPTNFTTNISYNYSFGVPSQLQDPNGIITKWTQDPYGRPLSETRPDGTVSYFTYYSCNTPPCWGVNDLRFSVFRDDYGTDNSLIGSDGRYWDGLNRLRYDQRLHAFGTTVNEKITGYDALGRAIWSYQPVSSGSNGYTAFSYDLRDREITANLYQSNGALDRTTSWAYSGRITTITDPRNYNTTQVRDVMGELRRVTDPSPGGTTYYDYDWFGNLSKVTDPISAVSTATYNVRGFKTQMVDADRGTWICNGDSLNELVSWTDAKNQSFGAAYDALGRMQSRTEPEGTSTWTWGSSASAHNLGKLSSVSGYGYSDGLTYDSNGRLQTRQITTDQTYQYDYAYNSINGAVDTITYPTSTSSTRFKIQYEYSDLYPTQITDVTNPSSPVTLWTLSAMNDYSSPTSESFGSGSTTLSVTRGYRAWTDELLSMQSGVSGSTTNRQNLAYDWDLNGNFKQRQDLNQSLTEAFTPDALNRVSTSTLNGTQNLSVSYDAAGNITSRSDVGSYTYGDSHHPHGVTGAGSSSFAYDANGNVSSRNGLSLTWASFNLPTSLQASVGGSTYSSQFSYGPNHQRYQQSATYSNGTEITSYAGGLFEKVTGSEMQGITWYRNYVPTPSGLTIILARGSNSATQTTIALSDHLGSSDALIDGSPSTFGNILVQESFSAFGLRRGSNWSGSPSSGDNAAIAQATRRGFTFHEELDNIGLIHMNGRVYDPAVGRVLSADPMGEDLYRSQSWNGYSYVRGNPLSRIDPTGFEVDSPKPIDPMDLNPGPDYWGADSMNMATIDITGHRDQSPDLNPAALVSFTGLSPGGGSEGAGSAGGAPMQTVVVTGHKPPPPQWHPPLLLPGQLPQANPKATTNPFKAAFCSFINNYAQGTAGFEIGDGLGLSVNLSFTNHGISLFVGGGLGVGVGWYAGGGATVGQSTDAPVGLRTFVSGSIAPPMGGPAAFADFSGGTDGFDTSVGVGRGYAGGVVSGLGLNFNIIDLKQAQDLCSH